MDLPKGLDSQVSTPSGLHPTWGAPGPSVIEHVALPTPLLKQPRQPRDLFNFAQPRRTRRLVSLTASPACLPKQATSLAVSPTSRPLQRTDPLRGLYPEIGAPSGLYPTSGARRL